MLGFYLIILIYYINSLTSMYTSVCVWMGMCHGTHVKVCTTFGSWFSPFTVWVLGKEAWLSCSVDSHLFSPVFVCARWFHSGRNCLQRTLLSHTVFDITSVFKWVSHSLHVITSVFVISPYFCIGFKSFHLEDRSKIGSQRAEFGYKCTQSQAFDFRLCILLSLQFFILQ